MTLKVSEKAGEILAKTGARHSEDGGTRTGDHRGQQGTGTGAEQINQASQPLEK
jgi:hypothetical protein